MSQQFERDGISFQYPENWQLEEESNESGLEHIAAKSGDGFYHP